MTHKFFGKSLGDISDLTYPKMPFDNSKLIIDSKEQFEKMLPEIKQWQSDLLDKLLKDKEAIYRSLYGDGRQSGKTLAQMDMAKLEDAHVKMYEMWYSGKAIGGPLDGQTIKYGAEVYKVQDELPEPPKYATDDEVGLADIIFTHSKYRFLDGVWYHDSLVEDDLEDEADAL